MRKIMIFLSMILFVISGIILFSSFTKNDDVKSTVTYEQNISLVPQEFSETDNAATKKQQKTINKIRVAIKTSGFESYYHNNVLVSSDKGMVICCNGMEYPYEAGLDAAFDTENHLLRTGTVLIKPVNSGRIELKSVKRNKENNLYRGNIKLELEDEGIVVINTLSMNQYLYSVVPSEMPASYSFEALKAQAICARSFAYRQILAGKLDYLGADVDDSTAYQVYNNIEPDAKCVKAVKETKNMVLTYDNEVISAYYYSTSCGYTASGQDVWFGMINIPYLVSAAQSIGTDVQEVAVDSKTGDVSEEKNFRNFIDTNYDNTYDSEYPWFRWEVEVSKNNIRDSFARVIPDRVAANESLVVVREKGGSYEYATNDNVKDIGNITGIKVLKRADGGIVTKLKISTDKKDIVIKSEYNIRLVLAPFAAGVKRADGMVCKDLSMLPSAFFYIDDKKENVVIKGGGYGHGVGMSQNGAEKMAEMGFSYEQILKHYYAGCDISS